MKQQINFNLLEYTNYGNLYLYVLSLGIIFFGIYTIISKNPIISVLFLIGLFCGISLYLILLGLQFIGLSYLIIYIGAISILFLFILMLINIRVSELLTENHNSIILSIITIITFNFIINDTLDFGIHIYDVFDKMVILFMNGLYGDITSSISAIKTVDIFGLVYNSLDSVNFSSLGSKSWDSILIVSSHITSIGNIIYTNLFILFIITSLILLLSMVGAIVITLNKKVNPTSIYTID